MTNTLFKNSKRHMFNTFKVKKAIEACINLGYGTEEVLPNLCCLSMQKRWLFHNTIRNQKNMACS